MVPRFGVIGLSRQRQGVAVVLALALGFCMTFVPATSDAGSSPPPKPGTDKYFIDGTPSGYFAKFLDLGYTKQGGFETACVAGPTKRVGDTLAIALYRAADNRVLLITRVALTEALTWSVLGQADGRTFKARVSFAPSTPVCSATWPEPHALWSVGVFSE